MTSQKTIERCRTRVKELEEANAILLKNNETLAAANKALRLEKENNTTVIKNLELAKEQCTAKCRTIVSEKEKVLQEKEIYIKNLHDTIWHLQNSFACKFYGFKEIPQGFKFELEFHRK
jgi:predicted RNase H-like nuclease (RuvC/YqgF family)